MTMFFSDSADFTRLSVELTASSLIRFLDRYFEVMTVPIRASGGVIDKYIGDAIMAYWGPPFNEDGEQAQLACLAAIDMARHSASRRPPFRKVPACSGSIGTNAVIRFWVLRNATPKRPCARRVTCCMPASGVRTCTDSSPRRVRTMRPRAPTQSPSDSRVNRSKSAVTFCRANSCTCPDESRRVAKARPT